MIDIEPIVAAHLAHLLNRGEFDSAVAAAREAAALALEDAAHITDQCAAAHEASYHSTESPDDRSRGREARRQANMLRALAAETQQDGARARARGELMRQEIEATNELDENGNPTGGRVSGTGIEIQWQDGPLGRGENRAAPNGAFVEGVLEAARQRIAFYQNASSGKFACRENSLAITKIEEALHWLDHRTREREARQVEGTHTA